MRAHTSCAIAFPSPAPRRKQMWRQPHCKMLIRLTYGGREGGGEGAGQGDWFHPFLKDGRKAGTENCSVVTLMLQAKDTTLITDRMCMAEYWMRQHQWTHLSPAVTDCTVRRLESPRWETSSSQAQRRRVSRQAKDRPLSSHPYISIRTWTSKLAKPH